MDLYAKWKREIGAEHDAFISSLPKSAKNERLQPTIATLEARVEALVGAARLLLDALGQPQVASGLRTGRQEVMLRIGNLHSILADTPAKGDRLERLARAYARLLDAYRWGNRRDRDELIHEAELLLTDLKWGTFPIARAALAPGEKA
jgi:hypothetical protein